MNIESIDHVYVETRDYVAARAFWMALGYACVSEWGEDGHRAGRFVSGSASVVVATAPASQAPSRPTVHMRIPSTSSAQARLDASASVRVLVRNEPTHWGTRWIRVADPDGNTWVLEQVQR